MDTVYLEWSEQRKLNVDCRYNHCSAETPFGRFLLTWKSWKDDPGFEFTETPWGEFECHGWSTVEAAKEWASQEMSRRISACLELSIDGATEKQP